QLRLLVQRGQVTALGGRQQRPRRRAAVDVQLGGEGRPFGVGDPPAGLSVGESHAVSSRHPSIGCSAPSWVSSRTLRSTPPAYPRIDPSAPITRWQGRTISSGLAPIAAPTARISLRGTSSRAASSPYVVVVPYGISSSARHTRCWNSVPSGARLSSKRGSRPAK